MQRMMGSLFLIFIIFLLQVMCINGCVSSQRDPYMNILQKLGISPEISQEISPESIKIQSDEKFYSAKLDVQCIKNC